MVKRRKSFYTKGIGRAGCISKADFEAAPRILSGYDGYFEGVDCHEMPINAGYSTIYDFSLITLFDYLID